MTHKHEWVVYYDKSGAEWFRACRCGEPRDGKIRLVDGGFDSVVRVKWPVWVEPDDQVLQGPIMAEPFVVEVRDSYGYAERSDADFYDPGRPWETGDSWVDIPDMASLLHILEAAHD